VLKSFDRGLPLCPEPGIEHAGQPRELVCLFRVLGLDQAKGSDKPSTRLRAHVTRQGSQQFTECRIPSDYWPGIALGLPVRLGAWADRGARFRQSVVIEQGDADARRGEVKPRHPIQRAVLDLGPCLPA
jgi:hypothetical protein